MDPNKQPNQPQVQPLVPDATAQQSMPQLPPVQPQTQKSIVIEFEPDLKFEVTSDKVDDMRFMDLYAEVSEDQLKVSKLIKWLIGPEQYESIYTYYESRGSKFSITKFGEVFEKLDKDLNAQPDFLKG